MFVSVFIGKLKKVEFTSDRTGQKAQTDFSCVKFDGHLSGIGTAIEDGDGDLLISLIEFMSVGMWNL